MLARASRRKTLWHPSGLPARRSRRRRRHGCTSRSLSLAGCVAQRLLAAKGNAWATLRVWDRRRHVPIRHRRGGALACEQARAPSFSLPATGRSQWPNIQWKSLPAPVIREHITPGLAARRGTVRKSQRTGSSTAACRRSHRGDRGLRCRHRTVPLRAVSFDDSQVSLDNLLGAAKTQHVELQEHDVVVILDQMKFAPFAGHVMV